MRPEPLTRLRGVLVLLVLAIWAGGCVRTTQPVLLDEQVVFDPALLGVWTNDDATESFVVTASPEDKSYAVMHTDPNGKKSHLVARLGKVDTLLVAEVGPGEPKTEDDARRDDFSLPLYTFALVEQPAADRLGLRVMRLEWLERRLAEHPDELTVADLGRGTKVVTASAEELQAFLKRHASDEEAFAEPMVLIRPKK